MLSGFGNNDGLPVGRDLKCAYQLIVKNRAETAIRETDPHEGTRLFVGAALQEHALFVEAELKASESGSRFQRLIRMSQFAHLNRIGIDEVSNAITGRRDR